MMTEDEAMQKWCPMVRQSAKFSDGAAMSYNRSALESTYPCRCIGSDCMMWRFHTPAHDQFWVSLDGKPEELWAWDPTSNGTYGQRVKVRKATEGRKGYCGLAGKPE